ncbi:TetR family transcriptional regulator [Pseudaminobacter salicylatoxidans]|uniref:TetR family transcriptional regulator n=2 Tax=Pseudaminobacter salicylatoxidans TaxID=93369 RepID=A0A316CB43_PSESE|nr:TetR family transcriptional regulator [Pseudaminobacter salicylatoxidans]
MTKSKVSVRQKILAAAQDVARDVGPGHLSLDAVAQRAGISKGGLLYHFPNKARLLEVLVEQHLQDFDAELCERERALKDRPNSLLVAYLELFAAELQRCQPPPSGILAAMAENPDFLVPVRRFHRVLLDRMKAGSQNENVALMVYLALEGMRSLRLFDVDVLTAQESDAALAALSGLASAAQVDRQPPQTGM